MSVPRRRHVARTAASCVIVLVAVLVAVLATRPALSGQVVVQTPLDGKMAPGLVGTELANREKVSLSSYAGRWVLVSFFASWCSACQSEAPQIEKFLFSRPGGNRPVVIGVLYGDTKADGLEFQRAEGASWPAVYDPNGTIASAWGVGSLPRSYLVNPAGRIVACILGGATARGLDRLLVKYSARSGEVAA